MGTGGNFPGIMRSKLEAGKLPSTSAEIKKTWVYTSTLPKHGDKITFTFTNVCKNKI
jgi:hypothetical protein